jgi:hypothetical protein
MRPLQPIAPRVRLALNEVAVRFAPSGVRLFVFGSAAPRWPVLPAGADLDIGFTIASRQPAERAALSRELQRALDELPTVRPVDVVDFDLAAPDFARTARVGARSLPDEHA